MGEAFEKIMKGLEEVKAFKEGKIDLKKTILVIEPKYLWDGSCGIQKGSLEASLLKQKFTRKGLI